MKRHLDITTRLDIDRPAAEVFSFVADQTNAPRWQHGLHEVRRLTPGPIGIGTEHVFVRRFAGMDIESRNRYTAYQPARFVAFEIPSGRITGAASYQVEPTGPRSSQLISHVFFHVSGVSGLATPILARVFARDTKRDEGILKALLETNIDGCAVARPEADAVTPTDLTPGVRERPAR